MDFTFVCHSEEQSDEESLWSLKAKINPWFYQGKKKAERKATTR